METTIVRTAQMRKTVVGTFVSKAQIHNYKWY